jgi:HEPN domain-containing protein
MKFLSSEWIRAADDDLRTIDEIIKNENLAHICAFHAQQCVEKLLKAILAEYSSEIPKIHSLIRLHELAIQYLSLDFEKDMMKTLDELYIDVRYPGMTGMMPNGKPGIEDAKEFYDFAKMIYMVVNEKLGNVG